MCLVSPVGLDVEDYLIGLCSLPQELVRFIFSMFGICDGISGLILWIVSAERQLCGARELQTSLTDSRVHC